MLEYSGCYTHRVAISNHRLISVQDGQVAFHWKDHRHEQRPRVMFLPADEFIRRFLLHTLPGGFQCIRFGGFFANWNRRSKLTLIRQLLVQPAAELLLLPREHAGLLALLTSQPANQGPYYHDGCLLRAEVRNLIAPFSSKPVLTPFPAWPALRPGSPFRKTEMEAYSFTSKSRIYLFFYQQLTS